MSSALTMEPVPQDKKKDVAPDCIDPVGHVITYADSPGGTARGVAYPERELPPGGIPAYLEARKGGARSFVLWADPERRTRLATLVTTSAADGVATYQVLSAQGEPLGTFVREKALSGSGLRTRWTVTQPGCPEAVGYKGRTFWWFVRWLLFPVQVAIAVGAMVSGSGDVARGPRRIFWRTGKETPLEFQDDHVFLHAQWCDWRLGAALVALLRSFDSWLGTPWDDRRK